MKLHLSLLALILPSFAIVECHNSHDDLQPKTEQQKPSESSLKHDDDILLLPMLIGDNSMILLPF